VYPDYQSQLLSCLLFNNIERPAAVEEIDRPPFLIDGVPDLVNRTRRGTFRDWESTREFWMPGMQASVNEEGSLTKG
jgi:hypothetical protein